MRYVNHHALTPWQQTNKSYLLVAVHQLYLFLEAYTRRRAEPLPGVLVDTSPKLTNLAAAMESPPALEALCALFGLSSFERRVLLLCVGMALIPNFGAVCAIAQENARMPFPTFQMAANVFNDSHWSALLPEAPLRRWQMIRLGNEQAFPLGALQVDEPILHFLQGYPFRDPHLHSLVRPLPESYRRYALQSTHQRLAERLVTTWQDGDMPAVHLCGPERADTWAIAAHACAHLHLPLYLLPAHRLPSLTHALQDLWNAWARACTFAPAALLVDCDPFPTPDPLRETAVMQLLQNISSPLILVAEERLSFLKSPLVTFEVPRLTPQEQRATWQASLGPSAQAWNEPVDRLVAQFNLTTPAIQAICLEAKRQPDVAQALWEICRTKARPRLDDLAQRIETTATWEDLVLPDAQRQTLKDIAAHVRQRTRVYQDWGFDKGGRGLGISALFAGQSGTGKTMAAEVIARTLQLDLYRIDLSSTVSKYIGETEKNLRKVFDAAEAGGAVLLFDEADALFGKRTQVKDSHDRYANLEVSYLLQRMETYQGLAILTTNLKDSIDTAFLRRLRFVVTFPFPGPEVRAEIWRRIFPNQTPLGGLDYRKLGRLSVSGGMIRNIALTAAFVAADEGEPVQMKHILQGARAEYTKLEKSLTDAEVQGWV
ncbi:ATP-binding protein [Anthocerotibacter panamensis]|uniref:ATP-binding protein n=1 Tax=Anthocerotibacter panamensis TaxID=2857077 RepID=UPI001C4072F6|nr:ATP-binding protein [Anthocerotibacter panamensis]